jgi:hypothetical protein
VSVDRPPRDADHNAVQGGIVQFFIVTVTWIVSFGSAELWDTPVTMIFDSRLRPRLRRRRPAAAQSGKQNDQNERDEFLQDESLLKWRCSNRFVQISSAAGFQPLFALFP